MELLSSKCSLVGVIWKIHHKMCVRSAGTRGVQMGRSPTKKEATNSSGGNQLDCKLTEGSSPVCFLPTFETLSSILQQKLNECVWNSWSWGRQSWEGHHLNLHNQCKHFSLGLLLRRGPIFPSNSPHLKTRQLLRNVSEDPKKQWFLLPSSSQISPRGRERVNTVAICPALSDCTHWYQDLLLVL